MATMLGSLLISLGLDSAKFSKGMTDAQRELVTFQKQALQTAGAMKDLGARMTVGITAPLAAFGGFAVKAASDAQELQSAFDETFGALSKDLTEWAATTGDAMGRSTQEIQEAANTFGIFFNQAAPTKQAAADLSKQFAVLAQDLSSFFNTDPTEALQKLRSGLSGESEPLRDFGVFLNEASVQAKAFQMGIAAVGSELTEQQKIMARAALIMETTSNAQGDVMRTADGTANRIRAAKAAFEELQVAIGEKLIPAVTPLIEGLAGLLQYFTELPGPLQTTLVAVGGVAASMGPLLYIVGSLKTSLILLAGAFSTTGGAAAAATPSVVGLRGALLSLQTALGPILIAIAAVGGAYAVMSANASQAKRRTDELRASADAAEATAARYKEKLEQAGLSIEGLGQYSNAAATEIGGLARSMRDAMGAADKLIAKLKELGIQRLLDRKAELEVEKKKIQSADRARRNVPVAYMPGGSGAVGMVKADTRTSEQQAQIREIEREQKALDDKMVAIARLHEAGMDVGAGGNEALENAAPAGGSKKTPKPKGRTTPTSAEIAARFADESLRLEMEALQARERLAMSSGERADLQLEMLQLEREQRIAEIDASEFSEKQKDALRKQVDELYGTAPLLAAQGEIIVQANEGLIAQSIKRDELYELEQRAAEAMRDQYDLRRDHLQLDYELAETQEERKRIAADILEAEQEYRRNQWEMVLASDLSTKAEKDRAQAILNSLAALEGKEAAANEKANRTEVERYLDDLDMSVGEMNEAIDGIRIDGLEALNAGLVDAMTGVKSLGAVFKNIANQIISDLLRIAIRKAIIQPLAGALFGGGGGSVDKLFANFDASTFALDGARAMGGPVLAGGNYLVGENGPEIFSPGSSGTIIPNHALGGGGQLQVEVIANNNGFGALVRNHAGQVVAEAAPQIMEGSAQVTSSKFAHRQTRSIYG
ncbi:hypothetical protein ACIGGE_12030 [Qipengyuania sp. NPDC077410]|uniref:hypothetical protein n=1 Tax=Qipengyuania sp. NPDC077410 TaxID=3364496 RepID=UPI0037CBD17B